jgi:predicted enzyme related to lactoylglutathione lyase
MPDPVQHFEVYGDDPEKLASFYKEVFDWKFEPVPGMEYWTITTTQKDEKGVPTKPGAINGGLMKRPMPDARAWVNYVSVKSLEETLGILQRQGGKVLRSRTAVPKMGFFAIVADPEMNTFGIWQDDPNAA